MRPNLLLITADDMGGDTPGCFGGPAGVTPTLDAIAAEGVSFRRAHVPVAVCQPSRSAMMTGRWPHRNGAEGFEPVRDDVPLLPALLKSAGYSTGILGKVSHLQPVERFGWDYIVTPEMLAMGRGPSAYGDHVRRFITDAKENDRPWFLMANAHDPHRPFHASDQEREHFTAEQLREIPPPSKVFAPDHAEPPGFLPDLPDVRKEYAEYLSSSRRCDDVVATILQALDGQAGNTMVVFLSDNGMAFPFAKANCYLQSTQTPLIVRWPGNVPTGWVDASHFVSALDLFPTFCATAGVDVPPGTDGRALTGLLAGNAEPGRDHVHTVFHKTSAEQRFEMRCVQDERIGYVWNAWSNGDAVYQAENMQGRTWRAMQAAAVSDSTMAARADFYLRRSAEELYRLDLDPDASTNLADDPSHVLELAGARDRMATWMIEADDPLAAEFATGGGSVG